MTADEIIRGLIETTVKLSESPRTNEETGRTLDLLYVLYTVRDAIHRNRIERLPDDLRLVTQPLCAWELGQKLPASEKRILQSCARAGQGQIITLERRQRQAALRLQKKGLGHLMMSLQFRPTVPGYFVSLQV